MLNRVSFIKAGIAAFAAGATPSPMPAPTATATAAAKTWNVCVQNSVLPYDRPLEIKMQVLDGPDFDLLKYRGSPVLINIFATWCEPCTEETPYVVQAANDYYARGLRVIGLNYQEEDNTVRAYRKRFSIPYPIAMDRDGDFVWALERSDKGIAFPVSLFITPDGYLYCFHIGSMPQAELIYSIETFLKRSSSS